MRHESLFFLFSPVTRIKGVGETVSKALERLLPVSMLMEGSNLPTVRDLLFHLPSGLVDRRATFPLRDAPGDTVATFVVTVTEHEPPKAYRRGGRKPYKVYCANDTGEITLVFFHAREDYVTQALPVGATRVISGRTDRSNFELQMVHPDIIATVDKLTEVQKPEAVYPLTVGLTSRRIAGYVKQGLEKLPALFEWIAPEMLEAQHFPSFGEALKKAHMPESPLDLQPDSLARMRLAYDEMLSSQLNLALLRRNMQRQPGEKIAGTKKLTAPLLAALPFTLTAGQEKVIEEIGADMASGHRMGRLLQGDVGSGKTIVALLAMLRAVEQGLQGALMVPTELIASQHYDTLRKFAEPLGVRIGLLTGSIKGKARQEVLTSIASGDIDILVGTHALFQEHVIFQNLALIVIDEQHRFGVSQRMALSAKGRAPHLLHMTATPIPRSLTMTLYGDMDCSLLKEKPAERKPIVTRPIPLSRYDEVMERLQAALARGEKAYWICPLIDGSSTDLDKLAENDIAAAETRYKEFKSRFGEVVGLVHGRMKAPERDKVMRDFASGKLRLLVATTVVEVGVDVRDATIMVIEKAERFGLSQLHQLRGRVGRGDKQSACVLLYSDRAGDIARERLSVLKDSEDGFKIAEADLTQRGGGDLLGVRQSGLPRTLFINFFEHYDLLPKARDEAAAFLAADPEFKSPRGKAMELLLQLFGYDREIGV